jgi:hypothetical protein
MLKRKAIFAAALCALMGSSLTFSQETAQAQRIQGKVELSLKPGASFTQRIWWLVFPMKKGPQIAAWVETAEGRFAQTLFVTEKAGKKNWLAAPQAGRPESLPVFYHAAAERAMTDALSSATPKGAVETSPGSISLERGKRYVVFVEVNHSFDYNANWPDRLAPSDPRYSGVNGQPSLVYRAEFTAGEKAAAMALSPVGTGSIDGADGELRPGTSGLTSALEILSRVTAAWEPETP